MIKRLLNMIKGFFGLFVGGLEKNNPEALLENEKNNLREQIGNFNTGLASHAGLIEKLLSTAKKLDTEEKDLKLKVQAMLTAGKRDLASQFALRLQNIDKEHTDVVAQLEEAERQYKELTLARDVSVKTAKDKIESITRGLNDMKIQKAAAELTEMANGMITSIGSSGDSLNRIGTLIEDERNKAAGRVRVAKDSNTLGDIKEQADMQQAMADIALQQFEASMGVNKTPVIGLQATGTIDDLISSKEFQTINV